MLLAAGAAQAQNIYRCGPGGTEYSQTPCPGGKLLESTDPRTAAQRAEAVRVAAKEKRRLAEMERERRSQQAGAKPALATGFNGRPPPTETATASAERGSTSRQKSKSASAKPAKTKDFVAVVPSTDGNKPRK
jgi:hypothetical protein